MKIYILIIATRKVPWLHCYTSKLYFKYPFPNNVRHFDNLAGVVCPRNSCFFMEQNTFFQLRIVNYSEILNKEGPRKFFYVE